MIAATASATIPSRLMQSSSAPARSGCSRYLNSGLLEIKAHVVDSLPEVGGQCTELYPDKPIYDIPAIPVCSGKELTDALLNQIKPFGATFHLGQEVTIGPEAGRRALFSRDQQGNERFLTKVVIVAGGVGSFQPRTLKVEGIDRFAGTQLHYRVRDPAQFAGKHLVIAGGGDSALDWALTWLIGKAESVVLVHQARRISCGARLGGEDEGALRAAPDAAARRPGQAVSKSRRAADRSARRHRRMA